MRRTCFLLFALLLIPLFALGQTADRKITVRGTAEDVDGKPVTGVKLEFLLRGNPNRQPVATGADGKYEIQIAPGMYDILAHMPDLKVPPFSGEAWLSQPEITLNVRVPKGKAEAVTEYDFLGEWRVTDENGHGAGIVKVMFEALDQTGKRERIPVYVQTDDGEKETDGRTQTDPAGRLPLRISESFLNPERVVAVVVSTDLSGYQPRVITVYPALQFSESGHLYPAYPEEYHIKLKKLSQ